MKSFVIFLLCVSIARLDSMWSSSVRLLKYRVVRYREESHWVAIKKIMNQTCVVTGLPYSTLLMADIAKIHEAFSAKFHNRYVALSGDVVTGFVLPREWYNPTELHPENFLLVNGLAVHNEYVKTGCAGALWQQVVEDATSKRLPLMLGTHIENVPMRLWCQKMGLTPVPSLNLVQ